MAATPAPRGQTASVLDQVVGLAFLALWRAMGLVLLPLLWVSPRTRPHVHGLLAPEPGWTWLHGASAGEHVAARALAPHLVPGAWRTTMSMRTPVPGAMPAPLDLPFVIGRWLDRARPARLVLVEAELWPGWLWACRRRGIPVAVVNARPGRGTARWQRIGPLYRWLMQGVVEISQAQTGDLKLAAPPPPPAFQLARDAFIAASTRPGDEARLVTAWAGLPATRPLLVLAPRHLERVAAVHGVVTDSGLSVGRRSAGDRGAHDVLLLDTFGELSGLFSQACGAFIGGTFDPAIGGHSPAEAFRAGLPVVAGPHRQANPAAWATGRAWTTDSGKPLATLITQALDADRTSVKPSTAVAAAATAAALLPAGRTPGPTSARPLLRPLVPLVRGLGHRRAAWRGAPVTVDVPVISVGGLAAGGSGKSPVAGWLAHQLAGAWVVGRGYGRPGGGPEVRVGRPGAAPPAPLGDELEMHRRAGLPVVSAPDRVAGARQAVAEGARFVILDDGFQHRRLHRDLDIVTVDTRWPQGRGPIPVGSQREPWGALERAHWLWLHHPPPGPVPPCPLPTVRSAIRPTGWRRGGEGLPLEALQGAVDVAVGIARPEGFLCTLLSLGLHLRWVHVVPDHQALGPLPPGCVVTAKDAARMSPDADVTVLETDLQVTGAEGLLAAARSLA